MKWQIETNLSPEEAALIDTWNIFMNRMQELLDTEHGMYFNIADSEHSFDTSFHEYYSHFLAEGRPMPFKWWFALQEIELLISHDDCTFFEENPNHHFQRVCAGYLKGRICVHETKKNLISEHDARGMVSAWENYQACKDLWLEAGL